MIRSRDILISGRKNFTSRDSNLIKLLESLKEIGVKANYEAVSIDNVGLSLEDIENLLWEYISKTRTNRLGQALGPYIFGRGDTQIKTKNRIPMVQLGKDIYNLDFINAITSSGLALSGIGSWRGFHIADAYEYILEAGATPTFEASYCSRAAIQMESAGLIIWKNTSGTHLLSDSFTRRIPFYRDSLLSV